jgi:hypothetical protein
VILLQKLLTVFAKVFGIHSTSAAVSSSQPAASLTVETSSVAVVGGGRRPARLRGKAVRLNCSWQVVEHDGSALVLRRSDEVPADVDGVLTTTAERIKKFGAGRRPENLEGLTVRVITTWTVHEDRGDRLLLCLIPS